MTPHASNWRAIAKCLRVYGGAPKSVRFWYELFDSRSEKTESEGGIEDRSPSLRRLQMCPFIESPRSTGNIPYLLGNNTVGTAFQSAPCERLSALGHIRQSLDDFDSAGNSRQNMERVDATCRIRLTMIAGASVCRLDHDFLAPKATSNVCRISMCLSLKGSY
jgi:hypothetical protein